MTKNTTYFKVLEIIFLDLFGLEHDLLNVDAATLRGAFKRSSHGKAWYDHVLKEKSNIEVCLIDRGQTTDFEVCLWNTVFPINVYTKERPEDARYGPFLPVLKMDMLAFAYQAGGVEALEQRFGDRLGTFDEFKEFLARIFPSLKDRGFAAVKSTLGYFGDLCYEAPDEEAAKRAWKKGDGADASCRRGFRDWTVHTVTRLCGENGLVFQLHTGGTCCGARYPNNSNPEELVNLICSHPDTDFDLFHAGYPRTNIAAAMVKSLPNAYLNLNWLPVLSRRMAERYVDEILDEVPMSKISWGGDGSLVEEVYAHAKIIRQILFTVLGSRIDRGDYDPNLCREICQRILRENALELYGL